MKKLSFEEMENITSGASGDELISDFLSTAANLSAIFFSSSTGILSYCEKNNEALISAASGVIVPILLGAGSHALMYLRICGNDFLTTEVLIEKLNEPLIYLSMSQAISYSLGKYFKSVQKSKLQNASQSL